MTKNWLKYSKPRAALAKGCAFIAGDTALSIALRKMLSTAWRNRFADVECEKILVTPYIGRFRSENTEQMRARYDDTVYPSLETVPYRLAIVRRNEWMVLCSDIVIAFVQHRWGGAAATLKYAQRKGKNIIYLHG